MFPCVDTYKLINLPTMLGGRAKEIKLLNFLPKVDNVQRDKKYSSQINLKALFKCEVTASSSPQVKGLTKQRGITLCLHPLESA